MALDTRKARELLGWRPKLGFTEGVRMTVRDARRWQAGSRILSPVRALDQAADPLTDPARNSRHLIWNFIDQSNSCGSASAAATMAVNAFRRRRSGRSWRSPAAGSSRPCWRGSALAAASTTELLTTLASPAARRQPARRRGRQGHRRLPGLVRLPRRRRADQRLVALEPRTVPAAVAAPTPRIVSWPDMREYTRSYPTAYAEPRQRPAGHAVLLLRPADRRHPLPVDAAERLRHRRAAAVQPDRRRGPDPRRDGGQGPQRRRGATAASSTSCTTSPAGRTCSRRSRPTGRRRCPRTPPPRRTRGRTASRSSASGASASTTPTARSRPAPCLDVINWFKAQGCYVIGGVPT